MQSPRIAPDCGGQDMNVTDQTRGDLLAALTELSRRCPDWRLGQTLATLTTTPGCIDPGGVGDLEGDEALAAAKP